MFPYDTIIESGDRSSTDRLLKRLTTNDLGDEEQQQIERALMANSDPRSFSPLEAIVLDKVNPTRLRESASLILRSFDEVVVQPNVDTVRRWWSERDDVLRWHALTQMDDTCCADVVRDVASDASHPLQAGALEQMAFCFDSPADQAIKLAGLTHPNPKVRSEAAKVLLWDEPIVAEEPLLRATADVDFAVVCEAANTLQYFPSQRVLICLDGLLAHPDQRVRETSRQSFASIRNDMLVALTCNEKAVRERIRSWLEPVWALLDFTKNELAPDEKEGRTLSEKVQPQTLPLDELLSVLEDPDTSVQRINTALLDNAWEGYNAEEWDRIRVVLLDHNDQMVRHYSVSAFADRRDRAGVLHLLDDPCYGVRKSAMYYLGLFPIDRQLAARAWTHLQQLGVNGNHATETLTTYLHHADPNEAKQRLVDIVENIELSENLRVGAVHGLSELRARPELMELSRFLHDQPLMTWALHAQLLEAISTLNIPIPELWHLRDVDSLFLQEVLAGTLESNL